MTKTKTKPGSLDLDKLNDRMWDAQARIERMFLLAGAICGIEAPCHDLEEMLEDGDLDDLVKCFPDIPKALVTDIEDGDTEGLLEWLVRHGRLGFLVQFATPVMKPVGKDLKVRESSWGCYSCKWVYGDTLEAALEAGFAWVAEQRKAEDRKARETA